MTELARELGAANAALTAALTAGGAATHITLIEVSTTVQFFATHALTILANASRPAAGDRQGQNFACLIVSSAGAMILDCASRACSTRRGTPNSFDAHAQALQRLMQVLHALAEAQAPGLAALRATTCSPEAIVAALRGLLSWDWDSTQGAAPDSLSTPALLCSETLPFRLAVDWLAVCLNAEQDGMDGGVCATVSLMFGYWSSVFGPECSAIVADIALQDCIVARAAALLRRLCALSSQEGGLASPAVGVCKRATTAFDLLSLPELSERMRAANLLEDIITSTELLLDLPTDLELKSWALAYAIAAIVQASLPSQDQPPRVTAYKEMVRCLGLGAMALMHVLEAKDSDEDSSRRLLVAVGHYRQLQLSIFKHSMRSEDLSLPSGVDIGPWPARYRALEAILRLTAVMPPSIPCMSLDQLFTSQQGLFTGLHTRALKEQRFEREAWTDLAGLVATAAKVALRLEGPEDGNALPLKKECIRSMSADVSYFYRSLEGKEKEASFPKR